MHKHVLVIKRKFIYVITLPIENLESFPIIIILNFLMIFLLIRLYHKYKK